MQLFAQKTRKRADTLREQVKEKLFFYNKCFYEDRRDVRFCVFLAIYVFRSGNQHLF